MFRNRLGKMGEREKVKPVGFISLKYVHLSKETDFAREVVLYHTLSRILKHSVNSVVWEPELRSWPIEL